MFKIMKQLDLHTNHVMGATPKVVNVITSKGMKA